MKQDEESGRSRLWESIDPEMAEVLKPKTPAERLEIANRMWRSARRMIQQQLRATRPAWTLAEIERETALRMSHGAV